MASRAIVERIDVVGHVAHGKLSGPVDVFLDALFLQAAKERLGHGIVPAVPLPTHARLESMGPAEAPPAIGQASEPYWLP